MSRLLDKAVPRDCQREATLANLAHGECVPPERLKLAGLTEADFDRALTGRAVTAAVQQHLAHPAMSTDLGADSLADNWPYDSTCCSEFLADKEAGEAGHDDMDRWLVLAWAVLIVCSVVAILARQS
jgi:hypothetical protein